MKNEKNTKRNKRMAVRTGGFVLALILLAGAAVPVQASALPDAVAAKEVKTVNLKKAKKIKLKNTSGKNKEEVAAIKKNLEKADDPDYYTDLNNQKYYSWSNGRLVSLNLCYSGLRGKLSLKAFKNLKELDCSGNELTSLDVSKNTELTSLWPDDLTVDIPGWEYVYVEEDGYERWVRVK